MTMTSENNNHATAGRFKKPPNTRLNESSIQVVNGYTKSGLNRTRSNDHRRSTSSLGDSTAHAQKCASACTDLISESIGDTAIIFSQVK